MQISPEEILESENPVVTKNLPMIVDFEDDLPSLTVLNLDQIPCKCVQVLNISTNYWFEIDLTNATLADLGKHTLKLILSDDQSEQSNEYLVDIIFEIE